MLPIPQIKQGNQIDIAIYIYIHIFLSIVLPIALPIALSIVLPIALPIALPIVLLIESEKVEASGLVLRRMCLQVLLAHSPKHKPGSFNFLGSTNPQNTIGNTIGNSIGNSIK